MNSRLQLFLLVLAVRPSISKILGVELPCSHGAADPGYRLWKFLTRASSSHACCLADTIFRMITSYSWATHVPEAVLDKVFNVLDVDGDGFVTEEEFRGWFADFRRVSWLHFFHTYCKDPLPPPSLRVFF